MIDLNLIPILNYDGGRDQAPGCFIFNQRTTRTLRHPILIFRLKVIREDLQLRVRIQITVKMESIIV